MEEEKKIYIGNLEYGVAESDLARVLEAEGINAKNITIIIDKYSGRSKGFGFAEVKNESATFFISPKIVSAKHLARGDKIELKPKRNPKNGKPQAKAVRKV